MELNKNNVQDRSWRNEYSAQHKYRSEKCKNVGIQLSSFSDSDIIERIENLHGESKQGYIKRLIREDIGRTK